MGKYASKVVEQAKAWLGCKESNGTHKKIIDTYNAHKPLARGYKVKYTDAWCATFVSAVAIKVGCTDIIPTECGCGKMRDLFIKLNAWVEDESVTPEPGWIMFYDWDDNGKGDNKGTVEHVGIVEKVVGKKITIIEGNYSNSVKRRTKTVNSRYIRGYGAPKYDKEAAEKPVEKPEEKPKAQSKKAKDAAKSFLKSLAGTYKVTASSLNVRNGAGVAKKKMVAIPKGMAVKCYGYYTSVLGTKWLYIQFTYKNVTYTGFASSKYLKK